MKQMLQLYSQVIVIIVSYHNSAVLFFLQCTRRTLRTPKVMILGHQQKSSLLRRWSYTTTEEGYLSTNDIH